MESSPYTPLPVHIYFVFFSGERDGKPYQSCREADFPFTLRVSNKWVRFKTFWKGHLPNPLPGLLSPGCTLYVLKKWNSPFPNLLPTGIVGIGPTERKSVARQTLRGSLAPMGLPAFLL